MFFKVVGGLVVMQTFAWVALQPLMVCAAPAGPAKTSAPSKSAVQTKPAAPTKTSAKDSREHSKKVDDKEESADDLDAKDSEKAIPLDAKSPHGLPLGRLNQYAFGRGYKKTRELLRKMPKAPGDELERKMWEACANAMERRYEESLAGFKELEKTKVLDTAPPSVWILHGLVYAEDQQFEKAIQIFTKVVAKGNFIGCYIRRAGCYASTNQLLLAARDYESAAKLSEFGSRANLTKAATFLIRLKRYDEALADLDKAGKGKRGDTSATLWLVRGDCYKQMGRTNDAIAAISTAIKYAMEKHGKKGEETTTIILPTCFKERAQLYEKVGKKDLAKADWAMHQKLTEGVMDEL